MNMSGGKKIGRKKGDGQKKGRNRHKSQHVGAKKKGVFGGEK